jgi:hypothetical protein
MRILPLPLTSPCPFEIHLLLQSLLIQWGAVFLLMLWCHITPALSLRWPWGVGFPLLLSLCRWEVAFCLIWGVTSRLPSLVWLLLTLLLREWFHLKPLFPQVSVPVDRVLPPHAPLPAVSSVPSTAPTMAIIRMAEPFKLPTMKNSKAYLDPYSIIQYYLHLLEFLT